MTRSFDDNGAGVVSYRAWLYGGTSDGATMRTSPSERYEKTAYTEARLYAGRSMLCVPPVFADLDRDRPDWRMELGRLTDQERRTWELRHIGEELETVRIAGVPVGEEVAMNRRGFSVVEGTKRTIAGVVCYDFIGREYSVRGLSREQIAARMTLELGTAVTVRQVRRWLGEAKRKLKGL